jgi:hypothetical protein
VAPTEKEINEGHDSFDSAQDKCIVPYGEKGKNEEHDLFGFARDKYIVPLRGEKLQGGHFLGCEVLSLEDETRNWPSALSTGSNFTV